MDELFTGTSPRVSPRAADDRHKPAADLWLPDRNSLSRGPRAMAIQPIWQAITHCDHGAGCTGCPWIGGAAGGTASPAHRALKWCSIAGLARPEGHGPRWTVLSAAGSALAGSASGLADSVCGPGKPARRCGSSWPPSCAPASWPACPSSTSWSWSPGRTSLPGPGQLCRRCRPLAGTPTGCQDCPNPASPASAAGASNAFVDMPATGPVECDIDAQHQTIVEYRPSWHQGRWQSLAQRCDRVGRRAPGSRRVAVHSGAASRLRRGRRRRGPEAALLVLA